MHAKDQQLVSMSSEASKQEQVTRGQEARYLCPLFPDTLIDSRCLGALSPFPDTEVA